MEDIKNNNTAPEEAEAKDADATREIVGIRFRGTGKVYYFAPNGIDFKEGEFAIVETVRGVEYGSVAIGNRHVPESEIVGSLKPSYARRTTRMQSDSRTIWSLKRLQNRNSSRR